MISFRSIYVINKRDYLKIKQNKILMQKHNQMQMQTGGKYNNNQTSRCNSDIKKDYNKCGAPNPDGSSNDGCGGHSYE